jgi:predicted SAM-dependent methyltransferase
MAGIRLYAGSIPNSPEYGGLIGLTLGETDDKHIHCDIRERHPFDDDSVDSYQAEDVFEHIEFDLLPGIIADIHRILKPNGLFRLSVPDYRCDVLYDRSIKDRNGNIIKDGDTGHIWFPVFEIVFDLLFNSPFYETHVLHFYNVNGRSVTNKIDYSKGYIQRTPDHDLRVRTPYRAMSIVIDCIKL